LRQGTSAANTRFLRNESSKPFLYQAVLNGSLKGLRAEKFRWLDFEPRLNI
jgi:hypothetical protein